MQQLVGGENFVIGRIVHYVYREGFEHSPAIIVKADALGKANLDVFRDDPDCPVEWRESVPYSNKGETGTWHWPERV